MIKPYGPLVIVEREDLPDTIRGIAVPQHHKRLSQYGRVRAVGPGRVSKKGVRIPIDLEVGDRVLVKKYSGAEVDMGDTECYAIAEDEILAVMS